jgi:hypothetical protein
MKQTPLLRWIEAAEARSICTLAEENPARAIVAPASRNAQPLNSLLASLREQLCMGRATGHDNARRRDRAA